MTLKGKIFAALFFFMLGVAVGAGTGLYIGFTNAPAKQMIENTFKKIKSKNSSGDISVDVETTQEQTEDNSKKTKRELRREKKNKEAE